MKVLRKDRLVETKNSELPMNIYKNNKYFLDKYHMILLIREI